MNPSFQAVINTNNNEKLIQIIDLINQLGKRLVKR